MKNLIEFDVNILTSNEIIEINGGQGTDLGNWLIDTIGSGICAAGRLLKTFGDTMGSLGFRGGYAGMY
ncbi:hypothetical protein [Maribacter sp. 2307ULW6-5]|uniref:hypothetical protein n=1 Tax=Maribacter sp. 2307ULW6-5 TaxID=3386275 RepID=UPI0039BC662F